MRLISTVLATGLLFLISGLALAKESFSAMDVFKIAYAANPVVSPTGDVIAFNRYYMDIMTDRRQNDLWVIDSNGKNLRQISKDFDAVGAAVFTHSGEAIAFVATEGETSRIYLQQIGTADRTALGQDLAGASNLSFSPDGKWLAFTMPVAYKPETLGEMPSAPAGAKWADPVVVETREKYSWDGSGYLPFSRRQIFLIPTEGGAVQQLTQGQQDYDSPLAWLPDSSALLTSLNIKNNVNKPNDTDIVRLELDSRQLIPLTTGLGPQTAPQVSPNGEHIAWLGYEDKHIAIQNKQLYTANLDGSSLRELTSNIDFSVLDFAWHQDSQQLYIQYEERGKMVLALLSDDGSVKKLADNLAGWELDQPYALGKFSANAGIVATTLGNATKPAELGVVDHLGNVTILTDLNQSLNNSVRFAPVTEYSVKSSFDQREIQYWIMLPPNFDKTKNYPLLLQIHGGPHAAYGPHFAANNQLYAAAGYVVVYGNQRGSTGYGIKFAQETSHNFPDRDYDDLMDMVDATIAMGFIDEDQLYVTGGSGGGVLTAWIVGKTDRFRAAAVVNPAINWISFMLTADLNKYYANYRTADLPWNDPMGSWSLSPLSLVGNVNTPTMIMTGENDLRTPMWESEQFFNALQIEGVDTALVRVPGASHWIEYRPSQLIAKVNGILAWFERYKKAPLSQAEK